MNYVVYDLEVRYLVGDPHPSEPRPLTWGDAPDMGMSCGCTWDDGVDGFLDWLQEDGVALLEYLQGYNIVVTYNGDRFDHRVLWGVSGRRCVEYEQEGDRLRFVRFAEAGLGEVHFALHGKHVDLFLDIQDATGRMIGLDAVAQATVGHTKQMRGEEAPLFWAQRKRKEVMEYCRGDVELTRKVFEVGLKNGRVFYFDRRGEYREVPVQWTVRDAFGRSLRPLSAADL